MTRIMSERRTLAMGIVAAGFLSSSPAQGDSTMAMKAPPVVQLKVTCEYVGGAVSPLQMHFEIGQQPWNPFIVELKNVQTGVEHKAKPFMKPGFATMSSAMILYFPLMQPGIYDVTVGWKKRVNNIDIVDLSQAIFVFKGLKIPNITLSGGKGTGCQV